MIYDLRFTKIIVAMLFFVTGLLFLAFPVSAHVLKTDKNIGAVVHIDPEDDPIVGEQTTIYFDVKDTEGKFSIENCLCIFKVTKNGQDVFMQTINGTTAQYNFPEKNIYTLELKGTPKFEGAFTPFTLTYDVRVERTNTTSSTNEQSPESNYFLNHIPHIGLIFIVVIVCAAVIYLENRKKHG